MWKIKEGIQMDLNVFHFGKEKTISRKIKLFFKRIKWAIQRATKGYSDMDIWDLSVFYPQLIIDSLTTYINKADCYPLEYNNQEEWIEVLDKLIEKIKYYNEPINIEDNPYKEDYYRFINGCTEDCPLDNFLEYEKVMTDRKQEALAEGLSLLAKHMTELWY